MVINGWSTPTKKPAESKETDRNASLQKYGKPGHWPHGKFTSFPVKRKSNCTQKSRIWSLRSQGRYVFFPPLIVFFTSHCSYLLSTQRGCFYIIILIKPFYLAMWKPFCCRFRSKEAATCRRHPKDTPEVKFTPVTQQKSKRKPLSECTYLIQRDR